jgi:signal transduction histidine kinase
MVWLGQQSWDRWMENQSLICVKNIVEELWQSFPELVAGETAQIGMALGVMGCSLVGWLFLGKMMRKWKKRDVTGLRPASTETSAVSRNSLWLGEMTASVAHEIRSPLTVLLTKCEQVHKQTCSVELAGLAAYGRQELKQDLETMIRMARRIENLTRTLGGLVRLSHGDQLAVVVPFLAVIEESQILWQERVRIQEVELKIELEDDPKVWGDIGQLSQVVTNLVNNSLDAVDGVKKPWIKIRAFANTEIITIKVMDNGPGMTLGNSSDRRGPSVSKKQQGFGLGLSIAKGIVENFHGQLNLDHTAECTCFVVTLPAANPLTHSKV